MESQKLSIVEYIWPSKRLQYYLVEVLLENCDIKSIMYLQQSYICTKMSCHVG